MEYNQAITPETARILTTEEMLALERHLEIRSFVDREIARGKTSTLHGWVMSEILGKVQRRYGKTGSAFAKNYIVSELCEIERDPF